MLNRLTALSFERSGGFVALGHPPAGEVAITASGATLRSEAYPAGRPLTSTEQAILASLHPASLRAWTPPDNLRDALTDTVALHFQAGPPVTLTFTDPPGPVPPGAQALAAWIRGEVHAIQ